MNTSANDPWIERSVALLEQSAQSLDAVTLMRLNRARQAALTQRRGIGRRGWAIGSSLAGATAALVIAFGIGHRTSTQPPPSPPDAFERSMTDTASLPSDDPLDLYENLDFYVWLNAEQHGDD